MIFLINISCKFSEKIKDALKEKFISAEIIDWDVAKDLLESFDVL